MSSIKIDQVAAILARAPEDLPWRLEGPCRHAVRRLLCLDGMGWRRADLRATLLVERAREKNGTRAPLGFDHLDESSWISTVACVICGRSFRPFHADQAYCGTACSKRAERIRREGGASANPHQHRWTATIECAICHSRVPAKNANQKYCSKKCAFRAYAIAARDTAKQAQRDRRQAEREVRDLENPRFCLWCSDPMPIGCSLKRLLCSQDCKNKMANSRQAEKRRLNGHANGHANGRDHEPDHGPAAGGRPGDHPRGDDGAPEGAPEGDRGRDRVPALDAA